MRFLKSTFGIVFCLMLLVSCDTVKSALQLTNCQYSLGGVAQPQVAGINIGNMTDISQIGTVGLLKIGAALATKSLPLNATINVKATNPGTVAAMLSRFDWAIDLEGKEMLNGTVNKAVNIPANGGSSVIPFSIGVDLFQLLSGDTRDNLLNFALNLANAGEASSKVSVRIRPSISIGGQTIPMGFITLSKNVNSK